MIRSITGYGGGNGPYIAIADGFLTPDKWANIFPGADRVALDSHLYFAFDGQANNAPIASDDGLGEAGGVWAKQACAWGPSINNRSGISAHLLVKRRLLVYVAANSHSE
jgi:glucan 1,3-beta-glucosidase